MSKLTFFIAAALSLATTVGASEPTLVKPSFGWVPGLKIGDTLVIKEIDGVVKAPDSDARLLWMGNAKPRSQSPTMLRAEGAVEGDSAKAEFDWVAEAGGDALNIELTLTLDNPALPRGDALVRLVVPGSQIVDSAWIAGGMKGGAGRIAQTPPEGDHILIKASDGWFAWQLPDQTWLRVTPAPGSIAKWQVQDNRKFGNDVFEIQLYGPRPIPGQPEPTLKFKYQLEHLLNAPVVEPAQKQPEVDLGPDVAMLMNTGPAEIVSATLLQAPEGLKDYYEFAVDLRGNYDNPFDPLDVRLDAHFRTESGSVTKVPGFFFMGYDRNQSPSGAEVNQRTGEYGWRVRFRPRQAGSYQIEFVLDDGSSIVRSRPQPLDVPGPLTHAGYVQVSPTNPLAFSVGSGEQAYIPVGLNVAWPKEPSTYDYDRYWSSLAQYGANFARVWLAPTFNRLCLERPAEAGRPSTGLGKMDQLSAMRVDHLVNLAEEKHIRLMLCTESFGNFSSNVNASGQWDDSPYNQALGGPLETPAEFFTNADARQLYRNRLRYIVARWGHSPAIFAWEFWNEVTFVDDFHENQTAIVLWHAEMADYLHAVDPYQHLVTTSFAGAEADPRIDSLPGIDLTQSHIYKVDDIPGTIQRVAWNKSRRFGKPHLFGEFGISHEADAVNRDATGQHLHDMLWSALFTPTPATAFGWWWDNYVAPKNLWSKFGPVSQFVEGAPVARGPLAQAKVVSLNFAGQTPAPEPTTVLVAGGLKSWSPGSSNTPSEVMVAADGSLTGADNLSSLLHGTGNHIELHNPVRFHTTFAIDGTFTVDVRTVSGYGGGHLKIYVDDVLLLDQAFIDEDGVDDKNQPHTEPLSQYNGRYTVPIPAGPHTILVTNEGADWLEVSYELDGVNLRQTPWLEVQTLLIPSAKVGEPMALIWVRNRDATWRNAISGASLRPVPPAELTLAGLVDGEFAVEWFDTRTGDKVSGGSLRVSQGVATLNLPEVAHDVALRLIPVAFESRDDRQ